MEQCPLFCRKWWYYICLINAAEFLFEEICSINFIWCISIYWVLFEVAEICSPLFCIYWVLFDATKICSLLFCISWVLFNVVEIFQCSIFYLQQKFVLQKFFCMLNVLQQKFICWMYFWMLNVCWNLYCRNFQCSRNFCRCWFVLQKFFCMLNVCWNLFAVEICIADSITWVSFRFFCMLNVFLDNKLLGFLIFCVFD